MARFCWNCGGDADEPNHDQKCDGKQGGIEERISRHRDTSAMAFFNAVNNGRVKTLQQHSYVSLVTLGPSNMMTVHRHLQSQGLVGASHSVSPRFVELFNMGFIREVGRRPCPFTGQNDIVWEAVPLAEWDPSRVVERERCKTCHQIVRRTVKRQPSA